MPKVDASFDTNKQDASFSSKCKLKDLNKVYQADDVLSLPKKKSTPEGDFKTKKTLTQVEKSNNDLRQVTVVYNQKTMKNS